MPGQEEDPEPPNPSPLRPSTEKVPRHACQLACRHELPPMTVVDNLRPVAEQGIACPSSQRQASFAPPDHQARGTRPQTSRTAGIVTSWLWTQVGSRAWEAVPFLCGRAAWFDHGADSASRRARGAMAHPAASPRWWRRLLLQAGGMEHLTPDPSFNSTTSAPPRHDPRFRHPSAFRTTFKMRLGCFY